MIEKERYSPLLKGNVVISISGTFNLPTYILDAIEITPVNNIDDALKLALIGYSGKK